MTSARKAKPRPRPARAAARGAPSLFSLADLEAAAGLVQPLVPPTPQYAWPLLAERTGAQVWVKHENHSPIGAFKVRGGITYMDWLKRAHPEVRRRHHGDARQSWPVDRARGSARGALGHHPGPARQQRREEHGDGELRRGACRAWPRLRRGQGVCGAGRGGARPPLRAVVRSRSWSKASPPTLWSFSARCPISPRSMRRSAWAPASAG